MPSTKPPNPKPKIVPGTAIHRPPRAVWADPVTFTLVPFAFPARAGVPMRPGIVPGRPSAPDMNGDEPIPLPAASRGTPAAVGGARQERSTSPQVLPEEINYRR